MPRPSQSSKPCPSCPFLDNNDKEFGVVAAELCKKFKEPKPDFWACMSIRESVKSDAIKSGRLLCHSAVYDSEMAAHPEGAALCAGLVVHLTKSKGQRRRPAAPKKNNK